MRDLMDQGTDDEEESRGAGAGAGAGDDAALVRRRRRRPRPELALRALEMPDAMDATPGDAGPAAPGGAKGGALPTGGGAAGKGVPNTLVSPAFTGKSPGGGEVAGFGSGCTTTRRRWEGSAPLEASSVCTQDTPVAAAGDPWVSERGGKGKGRDWGACSSSSGFGVGAGEDGQQDVSGGAFSENTSAVTLGLTDTSSVSESSTSFVKSRPIPDQVCFVCTKATRPCFWKVGAEGLLSGACWSVVCCASRWRPRGVFW